MTHPLAHFAALLMALTVAGTAIAEETAAFPGKKTQWNGFDKYDFTCDDRPAIVVTPKTNAPGNPWLWRGEFFGAFAMVDQALLEKGWYVAYLACPNTFGSPKTMAHWEVFYKLLTTEHGLSKKPVLLGMSRGGLYVYHWAALHPDEVGLIYGDAPVYDSQLAGWKIPGQGNGRRLETVPERIRVDRRASPGVEGESVGHRSA